MTLKRLTTLSVLWAILTVVWMVIFIIRLIEGRTDLAIGSLICMGISAGVFYLNYEKGDPSPDDKDLK